MTGSADRARCCGLGLVVLAGVLVLAIFAVGLPWASKNREYAQAMERSTDFLQRLQALAAQKPGLEARLAAVRQDERISALYVHADSTALASAEIQGRIKRAIEAGEGELVSTQALPLRDDGYAPEIAVRVRMTGDADSLASVLHALESELPLVFVDALSVRVQRTRVRRAPRRARTPVKRVTHLDATWEVSAFLWQGKGS